MRNLIKKKICKKITDEFVGKIDENGKRKEVELLQV